MAAQITFRKHIPTFVDFREPIAPAVFNSVSEMTESLKKEIPGKHFSHWAYSKPYVMGVWDSGLSWWVMGSVDTDLAEHLPEWKARWVAEINGKPELLEAEEVYSSCGDSLTLKDGSVVKNLYY